MTVSNLTTIKRRASARISRLTSDQANDVLRRCRERGPTMDQPALRELVGYCSQSLNAWAIRKVAVRAGLLPKEAA